MLLLLLLLPLLLLLLVLAAQGAEAIRLRGLLQWNNYTPGRSRVSTPAPYSTQSYAPAPAASWFTRPASYFKPQRSYTPPPKVYVPPPSVPSYCSVQPQMDSRCPGYRAKTWLKPMPASTPAYSGPPSAPSEYTFSYSMNLVDDILNNPDAAVQGILHAMDGDSDKVQRTVNSILQAAQTSPQKVADVLAKVAKLDPAKFAKLIAELSRAAMGLGASYRRVYVTIISITFGTAVTQQSIHAFSLALARDMAYGKAASAPGWSPPRDADVVISAAHVKLYGEAFAAAAAGGQASSDGLVAATASVYCSGNAAYAEAWAAAYSEVLRVDTNGCLILERAFAAARAMCVNGHAFAVSTSTASKQVLACGITTGPNIIAERSGTASGTKTITGPGASGASWPGIASQPAQPAAALGSGSALANPLPAAGAGYNNPGFMVPAGGGSGTATAVAASSVQASGGAAGPNALRNGFNGMTGFNGMMLPGFVGPNGMPGMPAGAGSTAAATSSAYSSSSSSGSGSSNAMAMSGATAG